VEVQCLAGQGVVQIQLYAIGTNLCHVCRDNLPQAISHTESNAWSHIQVWGKDVACDQLNCIRVPFAVTISGRYLNILLIIDRHPIQCLLKARDNLALTL
jgi:hypothetical protein